MFDNEQDTYIGFGHVILKSDTKDKSIIYIEASNDGLDSDDEIVIKKALEDQAESYLKKGVISYDHLHKIKKDPAYIIGEPLDVQFGKAKIDGVGVDTTLVKGRLYIKKNKYAQTVVNMIEDNSTRLGASVGGVIVSKAKAYSARIKRVVPVIDALKWDETAITHKPINVGTLGKCSFMPFQEFCKSFAFFTEAQIQKALMAGAGVNASTMTGGRALISESLGKQLVDKGFWADIIRGIYHKEIVDYKTLGKYLNKKGTINETEIGVVASIVASNSSKLLEKFK